MSHPSEQSPQYTTNYRAIQDLYNAIQVLRLATIDSAPLHILAINQSKIAFCEGVLSTFMALETMHLERMRAVADKLHVLSQENDSPEYQRPYQIALDILADFPIPYSVILEDQTRTVLNVQNQARLEDTQELPAVMTDDDDFCWMCDENCTCNKKQFDSPQDTQQLPETVVIEDIFVEEPCANCGDEVAGWVSPDAVIEHFFCGSICERDFTNVDRIENTFEALNECLEEIKTLAKDYPADSQISWNLIAMGLDIATHLRTRRDSTSCDYHFAGGWFFTTNGDLRMAVPPHMGEDADYACPKCRGWLSYPSKFLMWRSNWNPIENTDEALYDEYLRLQELFVRETARTGVEADMTQVWDIEEELQRRNFFDSEVK